MKCAEDGEGIVGRADSERLLPICLQNLVSRPDCQWDVQARMKQESKREVWYVPCEQQQMAQLEGDLNRSRTHLGISSLSLVRGRARPVVTVKVAKISISRRLNANKDAPSVWKTIRKVP
jgi:hypothetical protein